MGKYVYFNEMQLDRLRVIFSMAFSTIQKDELDKSIEDKLSTYPKTKTLEELGWNKNEDGFDEGDCIEDYTKYDEGQWQYVDILFDKKKKYVDTHRVYMYDTELLEAILNKAIELFGGKDDK